MKKIAKSLLGGIVLISLSFTNANAQKIGHIKLDSLIFLMPDSKKAQEGLQEYAKQLEQQIIAMQEELKTKYADFQEKSKDMAEIVKASRQKELNDLNQRIQDFQQQAQTDYQKKSEDVSKPIFNKAKKAVAEVAKENGFKYIFDTSGGVVIYYESGDDVFSLVMKKLGITAPPATTTVTPPVKVK